MSCDERGAGMSTKNVFAGVVGIVVVGALRSVFLDPAMPSHSAQSDGVSYPKPWDPPAPLAGSWPASTVCSTSYTDVERESILSRAYAVNRATTMLASRLSQFTNLLQTDIAQVFNVIPAVAHLEKTLPELRVVDDASRELRCVEAVGAINDETNQLLDALPRARSSVFTNLLGVILEAKRAASTAEDARAGYELETLEDFNTLDALASVKQLEEFAIPQIERQGGSDALFAIGLYFSDVSVMNLEQVLVDYMVKAERYFLKSEESSTVQQINERSLARAGRVYAHAEALAAKWEFNGEAAASRYRNAIKIAIKYQSKQASQYIARYAYFLDNLGRSEEALSTVASSLRYNASEPVALYLQVSIRHRLGELDTSDHIREAEEQLRSLEGSLDSWPEIEDLRAELHTSLSNWRLAADVNLQPSSGSGFVSGFLEAGRLCLRHGDVAQIALCLLCKVALP